nr:ribonuclease H-like domain-containing protein [Tanacetum cinerariifolium]
ALESDKDALVAVKMVAPGDHSFRRTVRDGLEQQQMLDMVSLLESVSLSTSQDRWICDLSGDGEFRVKVVRNLLDDMLLPSFSEPMRWVKCVPIKINIFAWRARQKCLPKRVNLVHRGVFLESTSCPLCESCEEDIHHVFFGATWPRVSCVVYAAGGIWSGKFGCRFRSGRSGFLLFGSRSKLSVCWKDFFVLRGCLFGYVVPAGMQEKLRKGFKRRIIILPPVSFEEHVAVQRETKARTLLLQSLPEDHMVDFHHLDNAREILLAIKARFGGNDESKKIRKPMLKQAFSEFSVSEEEGLHKGYDRALPPSWSQVALTLKTRGGLEYLSFDDLYNKLRSLEIDVKGGSKVQTEETKAMVSVDSMLNWNEHDAKNKTEEAEQVFGLMAGFESDFEVHAGNVAGGVNPAVAEFAMMGISPKVQTCPFGCDSKLSYLKQNYEHLEHLYNDSFIQVQAHKNTVQTLELQKDWYHQTQLALEEKVRILSANLKNITNALKYSETLYAQAKIEKQEWEIKFVESLARFDKWQESSKNLAKLLYSSMSTRTKLGLGFKAYIRSDEVCDLSTPSVFDPEPENREVQSLYESDKSSASETYDFASCVSSPKTNDAFSTVDVKLLPKSDVKDPSLTNGPPSCSFKENVQPPRNLCNKSETAERIPCKNNFARTKKCFVCGSKSHLIKDCNVNRSASIHVGRSIPAASSNRSVSIHAGRSIPAASRNRSASIHAGRSIPADSRNRPASIHAGIYIPAGRINKPAHFPAGSAVPNGWTNPATRSFFGPTHLYFYKVYWPGIYDHMSMNEGRWGSAVKSSAGCSWRNNRSNMQWGSKNNGVHPHVNKDIGIIDSGCSRSMTGNKEKLDDFVQVKGGTVTFRGGDGKITGKGTIRTSKLNLENVYYVEELQDFNLFSVSQICDKKNKVLFTDAECLVLTKEFQLPDESQVVLRISMRHDLYTFNLSDIQPEQYINCLLAKASLEESTKWHRRIAHVNFKTINKLAKHGLVEGLPLKLFTNKHNCVACNKGKQHKVSYKAISAVRTISEPRHLLHMDLFGPTSIRSIDHKYYSLVVTDDFSRFCWAFF